MTQCFASFHPSTQGHKPYKITFASDYFPELYMFAVELIRRFFILSRLIVRYMQWALLPPIPLVTGRKVMILQFLVLLVTHIRMTSLSTEDKGKHVEHLYL